MPGKRSYHGTALQKVHDFNSNGRLRSRKESVCCVSLWHPLCLPRRSKPGAKARERVLGARRRKGAFLLFEQGSGSQSRCYNRKQEGGQAEPWLQQMESEAGDS